MGWVMSSLFLLHSCHNVSLISRRYPLLTYFVYVVQSTSEFVLSRTFQIVILAVPSVCVMPPVLPLFSVWLTMAYFIV